MNNAVWVTGSTLINGTGVGVGVAVGVGVGVGVEGSDELQAARATAAKTVSKRKVITFFRDFQKTETEQFPERLPFASA